MKTLNQNRRVVVTGLGVVSSLGIGWEEFWKNLLAGKSGISKVEAFDVSGHDRCYAGEIKNFNPFHFMSPRKAKTLGRASKMTIAASKLALKDADLKLTSDIRKKMAVCIGTTTGEIGLLERMEDNRDRRNEFKIEAAVYSANALSIAVAQELKLCGHNIVFGTACSSGNYALGMGYDLVRSGKEDFALVGGSDGMSRIVYTGFTRLMAVASQKCQPFDLNREGMIPAEGAGVLLLETLENAQKRGAQIYAEVLGYGLSCDGHHMANPYAPQVAKAIQKSLASSNIGVDEVDYISAHGTGTVENDKAECEAIRTVFGDRSRNIPVSSIKSMLGHTMGAASALESIMCCLVLKHGQIPPTINLENQDPFCDIDCVPNQNRSHRVKVVLNNAQAFGGNNADISLGVYEKD